MEDSGVGLKCLLGSEVAWDRGVSAQIHHDVGHGWAEETGKIFGSVRKPSALASAYQGDNL